MPASNWIGGFKESGSAIKPCRVCKISNEQIDFIHEESNCELRNKESHERDLEDLMNPENTKQTKSLLSMESRIVGSSPFSSLSYFDITKCLVRDIMHLLDEGVLNLETRLMLNELISKIGLNIEELNTKIARICPQREWTVPPPLRKDEITGGRKISFSASEMSTLTSILPLVLSEYVSTETNRFYANYISLLDISASLK